MNTSERGRKFEEQSFEAIEQALKFEALGLLPSACQIFRRKSYYSRDREAEIEVDISIEVTLPGATGWSLLWVWECKDYASTIPASDIEEFVSKLQQIAGMNIKGGIATNSSLQSGALSFARSKGIAVVRILPDKQIRWLLTDPAVPSEHMFEQKIHICNSALLRDDYVGINRNFFGVNGDKAYDNWELLLRDELLMNSS